MPQPPTTTRGSPAKTEPDAAADSLTDSESGGAAAFAATHATDEGGSPAKKAEQDAAADISTDCESRGTAAFAAAHVGSSQMEEFPAEQSLRITTSTTQQSNDRCKPFCAHGTLPDRCIGGGLAQTALPSCCPLTIVSLILALAWLTKSQRVDRSEVGVIHGRDDCSGPIKARAGATSTRGTRTPNWSNGADLAHQLA
jgi:hypothetical protein